MIVHRYSLLGRLTLRVALLFPLDWFVIESARVGNDTATYLRISRM